jgi:hypothetical protein
MAVSLDISGTNAGSERVILRDALMEALRSDGYNIFKSTPGTDRLSNPTISFRPRRPSKKPIPDQNDLINPATFLISFNPDLISVEMHRATGVRILASLSYEDPLLFDRLAQVLAGVGICLSL